MLYICFATCIICCVISICILAKRLQKAETAIENIFKHIGGDRELWKSQININENLLKVYSEWLGTMPDTEENDD